MYIIVIVSQSHLLLLLLLLLDLTISILDSGGERRGEERRGKEEEGVVSWDLLRRERWNTVFRGMTRYRKRCWRWWRSSPECGAQSLVYRRYRGTGSCSGGLGGDRWTRGSAMGRWSLMCAMSLGVAPAKSAGRYGTAVRSTTVSDEKVC